jgi:membrane protease YdiL (CAAX protease family)
LIGGYILPAIPLALWYAPRQPALTNNTRGLLLVCVVEIALFSIFFALGWLASRASREELLLNWRPGWSAIPLGIGYSLAVRIALGLVISAIVAVLLITGLLSRESLQEFFVNSRPDPEKLVDISSMRQSPAYFWLTVTLGSFVVAGLREELWRSGTLAGMKALWPEIFGDREGQIAAVALIAIAFGLAHLGYGAFAAAMAALVGFAFGVIMVVHRSIWPAVIAHGFFDATTLALLPLLHPPQ